MDRERIKIQHMVDQVWQSLKENRSHIERILRGDNQDGDKLIVDATLNYVISMMNISDYDLEEE